MLGQVEDPAAATLEWSSILLRSFLMEAGLSMFEMDTPYMSYYLDHAGAGLIDAGGGGAGFPLRLQDGHSLHHPSRALQQQENDEDADIANQLMALQQQVHGECSPLLLPKKRFQFMSTNIQSAENAISAAADSASVITSVDSCCNATSLMQGSGCGGGTSSDTGGAGGGSIRSPWLDPRIWSRLPEKLIERVVASLPLPSFFRSRLVCKRWYSLLFSDSFLELCAKVRPARPWFLLFRRGDWSEAFVFDAVGRAWFRLDLSFLPPRFTVAAAAGGLLCCISEERGRKTVLICNPLTRACVQLPSSLQDRFVPTVGLVVDSVTRAYQAVVAGDDLISPFAVKNLTTEVYDSRLQQWRMTAPLPRLCNLESGKATYANGFFYCMNYSPFSVLAYDTESGSWSKIQAPMRRFLRTPNLVECRGRLVLVAAVEKNKLNVPKSIRIWGLQHSRTSWVELERMPQGLYEEFMLISGQKTFHCIGHGNLILITLPHSPEMLLYDFYEKVWRWAPRCPFADMACTMPNSLETGRGFHAFAFDPRMEASVY
ncbi:hypothetical protein KP509_04G069400 [Ceratopteris richardii]|uniref:F-box domain-containing protein n=1 Tax=Ceratopteris richardii TaxID=49495 RepID=A0A8T2UTY3_CERRI|nr:hypothetical protein KP509_04G069400 [Ceratopteris richardii]